MSVMTLSSLLEVMGRGKGKAPEKVREIYLDQTAQNQMAGELVQ